MTDKRNSIPQKRLIWKKSKRRFIPGLVLNEGYYHDVIQPILAAHFPDLKYAACRIGSCSDVLGIDTYISMDHNWGPQAQLFLSEEDHLKYSDEIKMVLRQKLPRSYKGFPTNWAARGPDNTSHPEVSSDNTFNPLLDILTVRQFVKDNLGIDYSLHITLRDWLAFTEQELLHIVAGKVFHSDLPELYEMRSYFKYYPTPVWLLRMYTLWNSISEEQTFIGRCHDVKDELGERLITTRIINKLMKLCFYLEQKYYPYSKWFGTGFSKLDCASELQQFIHEALSANSYKRRNRALCTVYLKVAEMHNALNITKPVPLTIVNYYERGYMGFQTGNIVEALAEVIQPNMVNELGISSLESSDCRIASIEPLLDDSNYARSPAILRKILFEQKQSL